MHAPPALPHALALVPGRHELPEQQPAPHDAPLHTQPAPPAVSHTCPAAHAAHVDPPAPHAAGPCDDGAKHAAPLQQPPAHFAVSHVHAPDTQLCVPLSHTAHAPPFEPHCPSSVPSTHVCVATACASSSYTRPRLTSALPPGWKQHCDDEQKPGVSPTPQPHTPEKHSPPCVHGAQNVPAAPQNDGSVWPDRQFLLAASQQPDAHADAPSVTLPPHPSLNVPPHRPA